MFKGKIKLITIVTDVGIHVVISGEFWFDFCTLFKQML